MLVLIKSHKLKCVPYDKWLGGVYLIFGMTQKLRLGFVHKRNLTLSEINQVAKGSDESFFFHHKFPSKFIRIFTPRKFSSRDD